MMPLTAHKTTLIQGILLALVLLVVLPLLNATGLFSDYALNLCGKYLALAILAMGLDLLWGYTGILSLGQAVFFGFGAYAMGMYLLMESSGQGVYGERIPDFMVWNRVTELPWFWKPLQLLPLALLAVLLVPAAAAMLVGFVTFRRRVGGTYFAILTQAMAFATWLLCNRNELNLGGTNGLTDFKTLLGFSLNEPATLRGLYLLTAVGVVGSFLACRWLVSCKMGLVLTAIREQEQRVRFLGYPVAQYKIFIFVVAAMLAGLAGALYVPQVGIITPNQIGVLPSLEVVVWVAAGGRGTLLGALLGAVGVNAARSLLTARFPEWWPMILGGLFVAVVLVFPYGVIGLPGQCRRGFRRLCTRLRERSEAVAGRPRGGAEAGQVRANRTVL